MQTRLNLSMYKEHLQISKESTYLLEKWVKEMNRQFTEVVQMANKELTF